MTKAKGYQETVETITDKENLCKVLLALVPEMACFSGDFFSKIGLKEIKFCDMIKNLPEE